MSVVVSMLAVSPMGTYAEAVAEVETEASEEY